MHYIHEREVLVREKYGSSSKQRIYVKPSDQTNIGLIDESKCSNVKSFLAELFLPQGYPDSVSKDYMPYQIWDTAQAFCSTITGTLATQEVLKGVGVGDTSASPLAATVTWVIKDGCGHVGRILFAYSHGSYLDAYSKKWRLYADTLNDAAMCIEIALPFFKNYTTIVLCLSTMMKAIVGVAGGATRAAMTQHHAVRGNLADVSAKDSAQETAVNLVASFTALLILTIFGNSLIIFTLMVVLHIVFNYFAVRAVCLRTLNEPRFTQVIYSYLREEVIASPCEVNRKEPIIFYNCGSNILDLKLFGFQMEMGCSLKKILCKHPEADDFINVQLIYLNRPYLLYPIISERRMFILIKEAASSDDVLCAYFHAVLLSIIICAINNVPLAVYQSKGEPPFSKVCQLLQAQNWTRFPTEKIGLCGFMFAPSYDLLKYVNRIAVKEWARISLGLTATGWDCSKNLLIVDEWRLCTCLYDADKKPDEKEQESSMISVCLPVSKLLSFNNALNGIDKSDKASYTIELPSQPIASKSRDTETSTTQAKRDSQQNVNKKSSPHSISERKVKDKSV